LRLDPSYHRARYNLCLALIGSARFAAAEKQAAILVKAQPETPDVLNLMGFLLIQSGRPAEALPYFQNALRSSPDDKNSMTNLGLAYQLLGQYAEASRVLIHSVHLYPEDPTLLLRVIGNALAGSDSATANRYLTHLFQLQSADQIETLLQGMTLADRGMAIDSSALARAVALQMHAQASQIRELADAVKEHSADTGRF
jgi:Flp pilus assembly protein TadD